MDFRCTPHRPHPGTGTEHEAGVDATHPWSLVYLLDEVQPINLSTERLVAERPLVPHCWVAAEPGREPALLGVHDGRHAGGDRYPEDGGVAVLRAQEGSGEGLHRRPLPCR